MRKRAFEERGENAPAESFRRPMAVNEIYRLHNKLTFSVCPRCRLTLEREYQAYCDRCGQALDWKHFRKARIVPVD